MADADFVPVPAKGLINNTYLAGRGAAITPGVRLLPATLLSSIRGRTRRRGWPERAPGGGRTRPSTENGTTHFSVVDKWGNVVSYTNTIESGYGIGVFAGYKKPDGSSATTASCSTTS